MVFLLQDYSGYTSGLELLGLLLVFLLVVVACYFVTRFIGGKQLKQQRNSNFTVIETFRLAQNKFLQLVKIGSRYFVLAICKDTMTLVAELKEEEITQMRTAAELPGFADILQKFRKEKTESDMSETNTHVDAEDEKKE